MRENNLVHSVVTAAVKSAKWHPLDVLRGPDSRTVFGNIVTYCASTSNAIGKCLGNKSCGGDKNCSGSEQKLNEHDHMSHPVFPKRINFI